MKRIRCACGSSIFKPANKVLDESRLFALGFSGQEEICMSCYRTLEEVMS